MYAEVEQTQALIVVPRFTQLRAHLAIARLDHSIKNVFILPGIVIPLSLLHVRPSGLQIRHIALGFVSATLIACSNYVINEILDAPFDRLHPIKCTRPAARGLVHVPLAYAQWLLMMVAGMTIAWSIGPGFSLAAGALWVMGCVYNISPIRTKDIAYLDVLTESINNPLRMLMGWYMVTTILVPPASVLIAYWMLGCYFMALKRFSEYSEIGSKLAASAYRRSFQRYTEKTLLGSVVFYASVAMLMLGVFIMRYRIELILAIPFIALVMTMYFNLAFNEDSAVQHPEKLYRQPALMAATVLASLVIVVLLYYNVPWIGKVFAPSIVPLHTARFGCG